MDVTDLQGVSPNTACPVALALFKWENSSLSRRGASFAVGGTDFPLNCT